PASAAARSGSRIWPADRPGGTRALFTSGRGPAGSGASAASTAAASATSSATSRWGNSEEHFGPATSMAWTRAPAAPSASAIVRPIPRLAPVTMASRPEKSNLGRRHSACSFDSMFEAEPLRRLKSAMIEKAEQLPIVPVDFRPDALDPKCHQIDEKLRQQGAPDALIAIVGIDADGIHDSSRVHSPELAEVDARHDETYRDVL